MRAQCAVCMYDIYGACLKWMLPEIAPRTAPRALVFRPLVKGNEALGTRLPQYSFIARMRAHEWAENIPLPPFPSQISFDKYEHRFLDIPSCLPELFRNLRLTDPPWDETVRWDRELASQTVNVTVKPWGLEGLHWRSWGRLSWATRHQ